MQDKIQTLETLLSIDVGNVYTRAVLFSVVDGQYRHIATGTSLSTANAPHRDIRLGINTALEYLTRITGRIFFDSKKNLITPSRNDGTGIDVVVGSVSAGPPLSIISMGIVETISLVDATNLAKSVYSKVNGILGLSQIYPLDEYINTIISNQPDMIIIAGGTDGGAVKPILALIEAVGLSNRLCKDDRSPIVLYHGNKNLHKDIEKSIGDKGNLIFGPNLRPTIDNDCFSTANKQLIESFCRIKKKQYRGLDELDEWAMGKLYPTSIADGLLVRALSQIYDSKRRVLAIDISTSAITLASALKGRLILEVYPELGLGTSLTKIADNKFLDDVSKWLLYKTPTSVVRDFIFTKAAYPASISITKQDVDIEYALIRVLIQNALRKINPRLRHDNRKHTSELLPFFEPIIATGGFLTNTKNIALITLALLDGLQPTGVTTLVLDHEHLLPALGAAITVNPLITIQSIDNGAFLNIGFVVSPLGNFKSGTPIIKIRVVYDDGIEKKLIINIGNLEIIPLPTGKTAQVHLQPLNGSDIGMGEPGQGGCINLTTGMFGLIIDGRGRPIQMSKDRSKCRENNIRWLNKLMVIK